jgi:thermolysin
MPIFFIKVICGIKRKECDINMKNKSLKKIMASFLAGTMVVSSLLSCSTGVAAMEMKGTAHKENLTFQNLEMNKSFKIPGYISGNLSLPSKESPEEIVKKYLKADKDNNFIVYKKFKNTQNEQVIKTIQTYKGIKVKGTLQSYIIGTDGVIHNISGIYVPQIANKITGDYRLSENDAVEAVKNDLSAHPKDIDFMSVEKTIKPAQDNAQYAYLVSVTLKAPAVASWEYVISGSDGKIIEKNNMMLGNITEVQGKGPFGDTRTLNGYQGQVPGLDSPQTYEYALADLTRQAPENAVTRPFRILTYEFDSQEIVSDADGNFDSERQSHTVDTHFYMGKIYEFYKEKFKRYSIDNAGMDLKAYCHYSVPLNAYFFPGRNIFFIGDGDNKNVNTFATAETIGHEFTHGVIMNECIMSVCQQSCSINEGLADLFGEMFSSYADGTPVDWLKLAKSYTPGIEGDAYLDYRNPQLMPIGSDGEYGRYPAHMDEFYYGSYDSYGAHVNAAILTKAFSLMCTGETFGGVHVTRIDPEILIKIMYKVITEYITPFTDFKQFALMSLDAAAKLYKENSPEYNSVKEGFQAVGILNATSQWSKINQSRYKTSCSCVASVQLGDKAYFMGGSSEMSNSLPSLETWEYDISNNSWSQKHDIPGPRLNGRAVAANNKIYLMYGEKDDYNSTLASATVDEYNPSTNTWNTVAKLPEKIVQPIIQLNPGSVITKTFGPRECHFEIKTGQMGENGLLTVRIQGSDDNINFRDLKVLTVKTSNSTKEYSLDQATKYYRLQAEASEAPCTFSINSIMGRRGAAVAAHNNKVYVIGGRTYSGQLISEVEVFDTDTRQWSTAAISLEYPRMNHTAIFASVNSVPGIYVFGGQNGNSDERNVEVFDINSGKWFSPSIIPENMNVLDLKAAFYKGVFHFVGNDSLTDGSTMLYNPVGKVWTKAYSGIQTYKGTCAVANDRLYYLGTTYEWSIDVSPIMVYEYDPLRASAFSNADSIVIRWSKYADSLTSTLSIDNNTVYSGTDNLFNYYNYSNASKKHIMKITQANPYYGQLSSRSICSVYRKIGDIDGNNTVNTGDLTLLKKLVLDIVTPTDIQRVAADINNDNRINSADYTILQRYMFNSVPYYSVGTLRFMVYGDVNNDGIIDVLDFDLVNNYIAGNVQLSYGQITAADVDGNGSVDFVDSNYIKNYIFNNDIIFPAVN